MAHISYQDINPADAQKFFTGMTASSRFFNSQIKIKVVHSIRHYIKSLVKRSFLPQIALLWNALDTTTKDLWTSCGAYAGLNGYRTFVQEQSQRLHQNLSVPNTPSIYHQGKYGHLHIGGSAVQIKIAQYHPSMYYVNHKVKGVNGLYAPVAVNESMSLPLTIGLSYKAVLSATGATQRARFYAIVYSSYQGVDRENLVEIDFLNDSVWHIATAIISQTLGHFMGYTLYFEIYGYTGDLYFDNIQATHSAVNWARDKRCYSIAQTFSNSYYQIPAHWSAIELPAGATYKSNYIDGI